MLAVVNRNAGRLTDLIEDLLTLSRMESDAYRLDPHVTALTGIISSAAEAVAPRRPARGSRSTCTAATRR